MSFMDDMWKECQDPNAWEHLKAAAKGAGEAIKDIGRARAQAEEHPVETVEALGNAMSDAYKRGGGGATGAVYAADVVNPFSNAFKEVHDARTAMAKGDYETAGRQYGHAFIDTGAGVGAAAAAAGAPGLAAELLGEAGIAEATTAALTEGAEGAAGRAPLQQPVTLVPPGGDAIDPMAPTERMPVPRGLQQRWLPEGPRNWGPLEPLEYGPPVPEPGGPIRPPPPSTPPGPPYDVPIPKPPPVPKFDLSAGGDLLGGGVEGGDLVTSATPPKYLAPPDNALACVQQDDLGAGGGVIGTPGKPGGGLVADGSPGGLSASASTGGDASPSGGNSGSATFGDDLGAGGGVIGTPGKPGGGLVADGSLGGLSASASTRVDASPSGGNSGSASFGDDLGAGGGVVGTPGKPGGGLVADGSLGGLSASASTGGDSGAASSGDASPAASASATSDE